MTGGPRQVGGGRRAIGDIAPELAQLTDDVLFEDVWNRDGLAARDRSLITVAAFVAGGDAEQLRFHLGRAKENGVSEEELVEAITHLAFYAGWPKAMTAANVAREVFGSEDASAPRLSAGAPDSPCRRPSAQQHSISTIRLDHSGASS